MRIAACLGAEERDETHASPKTRTHAITKLIQDGSLGGRHLHIGIVAYWPKNESRRYRSSVRLAAPALLFLIAACASSPPAPAPTPAFAKPVEAEKKEAPIAAVADAGVANEAVAPAPSPSAKPNILILGDSHAFGPFGRTLHELLATVGERVVFEAVCGATTEMFLFPYPESVCGYRVHETKNGETPPRAIVSTWHLSKIHTLDWMMKSYEPQVVVVALGTNYPRAPVPDATESFMKALCKQKCPRVFWIGPPAFGKEAGFYISKTIKETLDTSWKGALFIDSTKLNADKPLNIKKPHFGDEEAKKWAEHAFAHIAPELRR